MNRFTTALRSGLKNSLQRHNKLNHLRRGLTTTTRRVRFYRLSNALHARFHSSTRALSSRRIENPQSTHRPEKTTRPIRRTFLHPMAHHPLVKHLFPKEIPHIDDKGFLHPNSEQVDSIVKREAKFIKDDELFGLNKYPSALFNIHQATEGVANSRNTTIPQVKYKPRGILGGSDSILSLHEFIERLLIHSINHQGNENPEILHLKTLTLSCVKQFTSINHPDPQTRRKLKIEGIQLAAHIKDIKDIKPGDENLPKLIQYMQAIYAINFQSVLMLEIFYNEHLKRRQEAVELFQSLRNE